MSTQNLFYQSPIDIRSSQSIVSNSRGPCLSGTKTKTKYNPERRIFEVLNNIVTYLHDVKFYLIEYHFHVPSEFYLEGKSYPSELHYVFSDLESDRAGQGIPKGNILIIARLIENSPVKESLENLNVFLPSQYYELDGATELAPVRWIVGRSPIAMNVETIQKVAKPARSLYPANNRIILLTTQ